MRRLRIRCRRTRRRHSCAGEGADRPPASRRLHALPSLARRVRSDRCAARPCAAAAAASRGFRMEACRASAGTGLDCARRHARSRGTGIRRPDDRAPQPAPIGDARQRRGRGRRDRLRAGSRTCADRVPAAGARHSDGFGRLKDRNRRDHRRGARVVVRQRRTARAAAAPRGSDLARPAVPVGCLPRLDGDQRVAQTLRHRADLARAHAMFAIAMHERADACQHRSRP